MGARIFSRTLCCGALKSGASETHAPWLSAWLETDRVSAGSSAGAGSGSRPRRAGWRLDDFEAGASSTDCSIAGAASRRHRGAQRHFTAGDEFRLPSHHPRPAERQRVGITHSSHPPAAAVAGRDRRGGTALAGFRRPPAPSVRSGGNFGGTFQTGPRTPTSAWATRHDAADRAGELEVFGHSWTGERRRLMPERPQTVDPLKARRLTLSGGHGSGSAARKIIHRHGSLTRPSRGGKSTRCARLPCRRGRTRPP
jgi:hypothetical protein